MIQTSLLTVPFLSCIAGGSPKTLDCSFCGKKCSSRYNLKKHVRDIHLNKGNKFSCRLCQRTYGSLNSLQVHCSVAHPTGNKRRHNQHPHSRRSSSSGFLQVETKNSVIDEGSEHKQSLCLSSDSVEDSLPPTSHFSQQDPKVSNVSISSDGLATSSLSSPCLSVSISSAVKHTPFSSKDQALTPTNSSTQDSSHPSPQMMSPPVSCLLSTPSTPTSPQDHDNSAFSPHQGFSQISQSMQSQYFHNQVRNPSPSSSMNMPQIASTAYSRVLSANSLYGGNMNCDLGFNSPASNLPLASRYGMIPAAHPFSRFSSNYPKENPRNIYSFHSDNED